MAKSVSEIKSKIYKGKKLTKSEEDVMINHYGRQGFLDFCYEVHHARS